MLHIAHNVLADHAEGSFTELVLVHAGTREGGTNQEWINFLGKQLPSASNADVKDTNFQHSLQFYLREFFQMNIDRTKLLFGSTFT